MNEQKFNKRIIEDIAERIDCGERVYLHLETGEVRSYPVPVSTFEAAEFDFMKQEVYDVVDNDPEGYLRFDPLNSKVGYEIMEAFVEKMRESPKKALVVAALQGRKPFRIFRETVENHDLLDDWYDFKESYLKMMVSDLIDKYYEDNR
jgi:hypothetical protein